MNILVLNAGSSSLKFRLFRIDALRSLAEPEEILAGGQVERIGKPDAQRTLFRGMPDSAPKPHKIGVGSVREAAEEILTELTQPSAHNGPPLAIDTVGHRIVHGGPYLYQPVRIDKRLMAEVQALTELAPLHNPSGLAGIEAVQQSRPQLPNVAVFDTAFHHNLPEVAARYALPADLTARLQLRRYGFHGISYRYVSERLALHLGSMPSRMVICHLGNGASVCALQDGRSIDTSMGFTPLEGLIMGNRSGDVDPGLLLHLLRAGHLSLPQLDDLLNHQSGLQGLSGSSSDVRDLEKAESAGDSAAHLALECFAYRVRKYIGAYAAALGGIDALVFTGGIGEHSASLRARICQNLEFLKLNLDSDYHPPPSGRDLTALNSQHTVWIVPTDEERQIARETFSCLNHD